MPSLPLAPPGLGNQRRGKPLMVPREMLALVLSVFVYERARDLQNLLPRSWRRYRQALRDVLR